MTSQAFRIRLASALSLPLEDLIPSAIGADRHPVLQKAYEFGKNLHDNPTIREETQKEIKKWIQLKNKQLQQSHLLVNEPRVQLENDEKNETTESMNDKSKSSRTIAMTDSDYVFASVASLKESQNSHIESESQIIENLRFPPSITIETQSSHSDSTLSSNFNSPILSPSKIDQSLDTLSTNFPPESFDAKFQQFMNRLYQWLDSKMASVYQLFGGFRMIKNEPNQPDDSAPRVYVVSSVVFERAALGFAAIMAGLMALQQAHPVAFLALMEYLLKSSRNCDKTKHEARVVVREESGEELELP